MAQTPDYRRGDAIGCKNCGRARVQWDGVCEKCLWDNDAGEYASVSRPTEYDALGRKSEIPDNDVFGTPDARSEVQK